MGGWIHSIGFDGYGGWNGAWIGCVGLVGGWVDRLLSMMGMVDGIVGGWVVWVWWVVGWVNRVLSMIGTVDGMVGGWVDRQ